MSNPFQIRAARHLLGLSQETVSQLTGLSIPTIKRAESERDVSVSGDAIALIRTALEEAGVRFLADGEATTGGPGVRLK